METLCPLNNHVKISINRTTAAVSQGPTQVSLHCILQASPYKCSLCSALYKTVKSFKDFLLFEPLHNGLQKETFFQMKLAGVWAAKLTARSALTGTAWHLP